ncbi:lysylphosphatidylglycerol synthase transmembrane domain-containing protein [Oricola cellulosilytica]|uniref:Flippase-like domain-containing protein n=1 Tax=Oricola cellulosilytica TaxID=1429082 RepID=A0A4R0P882_9HYPH|nr:lysylphosphatidylglycerol synthase transmembrane domain-containing protein [Oricola cellulosilytica]TCD13231.1 flippase-like domain-containing protein [Oricola cellulosilytica]
MSRILTHWVLPAVGGGLALALIFRLYGGLDFARFLQGLRDANPFWLLLLAATILLEQWLSGWKWRQILHDVKPVATMRLTGALLAGHGVNALVPLGISPLVRAWLVARLERLKMATVLATTIIARFLDGVVFALFAGVVAAAGRIPQIEGDLRLGLSVAGVLNLALFGGLLWALFRFRALFAREGPLICRLFDWTAARMKADGPGLRVSLCDGIVWPRARARRLAAIAAAVAGKLVAATHFVWAGLAVGVVLSAWDYLFLMVFTGFVMVLGRFVRIPASFVFGAGFALKALGVADEPALLMILFNYIITIILVVGIGLFVLWQSGIDIRQARIEAEAANAGL